MIELRKKSRQMKIGEVTIGGGAHWALIAGPCAIENREMALRVAETLSEITSRLGIPYIFKGSFDKANRMSIDTGRGVGMAGGLDILARIKESVGVPVITDIHEPGQAEIVARTVDCIQIPAFLCRQTDLVVAAAKTGIPLNIKKGQFLAPGDMRHIVGKAKNSGGGEILLTERGTSFGYHNLVVDFRGIPIMAETGCPIVMDVSHSQQRPGAGDGSTGGSREFIPHFAAAALTLGVDAIFLEVHPEPERAISDKKTQWPLDEAEELLKFLVERACG